jgi:CO/xanthine dehydrogenase FAD-binding subunit
VEQPLYLRPTRVEDALAALASRSMSVLAGGTDFYPARVGRPVREHILDITALSALRGIERAAGGWRIGALTTWTDLLRSSLPTAFDGLKRAAREVGGLQIQNAGTIGGNLCNASPAADGVPVLMALDASVELASIYGVRELPLGEFLIDARRTRCEPNELLTGVRVPECGPGARSTFRKLGARRYLVISIVMVAVTLHADADGLIQGAGVAVGACSPIARRLPTLEAALQGRRLSEPLAQLVQPGQLAGLAPIDDIRGSADYRLDAAAALLRSALEELSRE